MTDQDQQKQDRIKELRNKFFYLSREENAELWRLMGFDEREDETETEGHNATTADGNTQTT